MQASSSVKRPDLVPATPEGELPEPATPEPAMPDPAATESAALDAAVRDDLLETLSGDVSKFVNRLLTAGHRGLFAAMEKADLSITQVKSLHALADADEPISLGAVSDTLGLSLPGISRSVDGLVQRGFVKREEDPRDRRCKLVTVTGRGRATYERLTALRLAGIRTVIADLEPEEQRSLADALAPVIRRLGL